MILIFLIFCLSPSAYSFDELKAVNVLHIGESLRVNSSGIQRVTVSNKRILRVVRDQDALLINARSRGTASIHIQRRDNKRANRYVFTVLSAQVYKKVSEIREILKGIPGLRINVAGDSVYITGTVASKEEMAFIKRVVSENDNVMNYARFSNSAEERENQRIKRELSKIGLYDITISRLEGRLLLEASARTESQIEQARHYLGVISPEGRFDIKLVPYQVDIDVKIVELSRSESRQMGLELPSEIHLTRHTVLSRIEIDSVLRLSESQGRARLISNPSLSANDGRSARFHAGGSIPIRLASRYSSRLEWKNYGVILNFTPKVINTDVVELKILSEFSTMKGASNKDGEIPSFSVREVETVVTMDSGRSVVISGLVNRSVSRSSTGLPGMSGIPILSGIFSSNSSDDEESELAIIVTASVRLRSEELNIHRNLERILVESMAENI